MAHWSFLAAGLCAVLVGMDATSGMCEEALTPKKWEAVVKHRIMREPEYSRWVLTWEMRYFHPRGTLVGKNGLRTNSDGEFISNADMHYTTMHSLVLDGNKVRWEEHGEKWNNLFETTQPIVHIDLTDGHRWNMLHHVAGTPTDNSHLGWIIGKTMSDAQQAPELGPILLLHQPSNPVGRQHCLSNWQSNSTPQIVLNTAGDRLWSYELRNAQLPKERLTVWIDPARDLVVRRFDLSAGVTTIETEFRQVEGRWVPDRWKTQVHLPPNKDLFLEHSCAVSQVDFPSEIDPATFTMDFPPGTIVVDTSKPRPTANAPRPIEKFLIRPDGSRRTITRAEAERGATYDEIARTESGLAGLDRQRGLPRWAVYAIGIGLLSCVAILYKVYKRQ